MYESEPHTCKRRAKKSKLSDILTETILLKLLTNRSISVFMGQSVEGNKSFTHLQKFTSSIRRNKLFLVYLNSDKKKKKKKICLFYLWLKCEKTSAVLPVLKNQFEICVRRHSTWCPHRIRWPCSGPQLTA